MPTPFARTWLSGAELPARSWTCGWCGVLVGARIGYHTMPEGWYIYPCPHCSRPTSFVGDIQMPGVAFGAEVEHLPADIGALYAEARNCMTVSAWTASVLACRKLLMNVAVSQGAPENASFVAYVQYLGDSGFVPPNARGWIDHIRKKGNEATHQIPRVERKDAEDLLTFMEMILKLVFDYPSRALLGE